MRLNESCDALAKQCAREKWNGGSRSSALRPLNDRATLTIGGSIVTNNFRKRLQDAATEEDMKDYLCERNEWTKEVLQWVDWEHLEIAPKRIFSGTRTMYSRIIKLLHSIQSTGRQKKLFSQHQRGPEVSNRCPCCMIREETTLHLTSAKPQKCDG